MHCPKCRTENPSGAKFCNECAVPLPLPCPSCGSENPAGAKFCNECATPLSDKSKGKSQPQPPASYTPPHLAERIQAEREAMEARGVTDGERKNITALFADIKGSTDLIADLDPEEARAILDPTLQLMMEAVHRYEGYVAQSLGDGIFALCGAPIAHEDHPQLNIHEVAGGGPLRTKLQLSVRRGLARFVGRHNEMALLQYDTRQHRALASLYAVDPGVYCLSYLLWTLVHLGYSDRALERSREVLKLANELSHPHSQVFALTFAAWGHQMRREAQVTQEQAEVAITLSTEHGFPDWLAWATTQRGWALAEQGDQTRGIEYMLRGLAASRSTGAELLRPYFLALLAATYGDAGQSAEGLRILEEALVLVQKNDIGHYEAELYRLKGELTLQKEARGLRLETGRMASQKSKGKSQDDPATRSRSGS